MTQGTGIGPLHLVMIGLVAAAALAVVGGLVWGLRRWLVRFLPDLR